LVVSAAAFPPKDIAFDLMMTRHHCCDSFDAEDRESVTSLQCGGGFFYKTSLQ